MAVEVKKATRSINTEVPLDSINILPQIRKTFDPEALRNLADDITERGRLIFPLVVACLDPKSCGRYLEYMKGFRQVPQEVQDLKMTRRREGRFSYILIDGERRARAVKLAYPKEPEKLVEARLFINIPPSEAIELQSAANMHRPVEVKEEALDYVALYKMRKAEDPSYTKARFAKSVGRSVSTINSALKFCDLPADIQEAVEKGHLPFGAAIGIASLQEKKLSDDELSLKKIIRKCYVIPSFRY